MHMYTHTRQASRSMTKNVTSDKIYENRLPQHGLDMDPSITIFFSFCTFEFHTKEMELSLYNS